MRLIQLFIITLLFTTAGNLYASTTYPTASVRSGDNLEVFLRRYHLEPHNCNIDLFCSINNIKDKNLIKADKSYKLPVKLYKFNGKSIRSTIGITDRTLAEKIGAYNKSLTKAGLKPKKHTNAKMLWVPLDDFECPRSTQPNITDLPNSSSSVGESSEIRLTDLKKTGINQINVPLMGRGYDIINIEDYTLKGQVYYIISGHGGPDPGAMCIECVNPLCEDEYAYDVSLRLARNLMQHGATVHMIVQDENDGIRDDQYLKCDNDEVMVGGKTIPLNQKQRLRQRAETVNALYRKYKTKGVKIQKAIEIHVDSRGKDKRQDVFFYYNKHDSKSKELAETVQGVFEAKYALHQKDRGYHGFVEDRGLYMVRTVKPTNVFVELANIRNPDDQRRLLINTNRQALANWLFEGMRK